MNTEELIKSAMDLTMMMGLSEGPRNTEDQLGIAVVNVLAAIALELKRANDNTEAEQEHQEEWAERQRMIDLYSS